MLEGSVMCCKSDRPLELIRRNNCMRLRAVVPGHWARLRAHKTDRIQPYFSGSFSTENAVIMPSFLYVRHIVCPAHCGYRDHTLVPSQFLVVHAVVCISSYSSLLSRLLDALGTSVQRTLLPGLGFGHVFASLLVFGRVSLWNM